MGCWGPPGVGKVLSVGGAWHEMLGRGSGDCLAGGDSDIYSLASRMGPVILQ